LNIFQQPSEDATATDEPTATEEEVTEDAPEEESKRKKRASKHQLPITLYKIFMPPIQSYQRR
jgi:hypothetical protein